MDNAKEFCPIFPGNGHPASRPFLNPPDEKEMDEDVLAEFRRTRDLIYNKFK